MDETKLSLKLLVDKKFNRVLFAEVGKDFVDFLFNLLSLPIGIVIRLFESSKMVGSIGNLYSSLENMDETYIEQNRSKDTLLKPQLSASTSIVPMLLPEISRQTPPPTTRKLYVCSNNHRCVTDIQNSPCVYCNYRMQYEARFISSEGKAAKQESSDVGYVRGLITYMVMDDLTVTPISMISGVAMMKKCNIQDFSSLEEKVVECGTEEGVEILKASLTTKEVLTNVFMTKELKVGDVPN